MSVTVTVCVQVAVFPEASATVQVTVVVPKGKLAGASLVTLLTEQLSVVTGVPKLTPVAEQEPRSAFTLTFEGHTMVGFWLSVTVTFCVQLAVLPAPSVTVHVTTVVPPVKAAGASLVTLATVQLSEVTGVPNATPVAVHVPASGPTVIAAGQTMVGSWLSVTVTVCVQVAVLPAPSVTVHVTVVAPNGKLAGASFVTLATVQLSEVVGEPRVTPVAEQEPASVFALTLEGHTMVGFWLSVTVTVCVQVAVLPALSVTVQVTVVVPNGKLDGASLVTLATIQLSEVTGVPKATEVAEHEPASVLTVILEGQVMTGFSVSVTETV